jgi:flagellar hook-associated protein 3 FlgL
MIRQVRYNGSVDPKNVEIDELSYARADTSGSRTFWAERQSLFSEVDATAYQVREDTAIEVDGISVPLAAGDNVYAIIAKINDSGAAVKASLDPVTNGLNLETTDARQLWLKDASGGDVLSSLGLVKAGQRPPYNLADSVRVSGVDLRRGHRVQGRAPLRRPGSRRREGTRRAGRSIDSLATRLAEIGSRYERTQATVASSRRRR